MKINIVQIGNSKGVRIPKSVLTQCRITNEINMEVKGRSIIMTPVEQDSCRKGWKNAFQKMHENKDDELIIDDSIDLEGEDWKW